MSINLYIPLPLGFCAGVTNAIDTSLKLFKYIKERPIYFYHAIVHNHFIKADFESRGAVFVEDLVDVPEGSYVVFSAHGVSDEIEKICIQNYLKPIDLTCPLVTKVHRESNLFQNEDCDIIYIGKKDHQESKGTLGRIKTAFYIIESEKDVDNLNPHQIEQLAYVSQTTLNVNDVKKIVTKLKNKFPQIKGSELNNICAATKNRQGSLKNIIKNYPIDLVLVIGSKISSNSNKLVEVGMGKEEDKNIKSYLIDNYNEIKSEWFENIQNIVLTAGASAPQILIDETINFIVDKYCAKVEFIKFIDENTKFHPPKAFRDLEKEYRKDKLEN
jgi:4-hydroxy-3-methylbut-2-enyl diphosphate reductase